MTSTTTPGAGGSARAIVVPVEIDPVRIGTYNDQYLAFLWHVAQWNPAPHGDKTAGDVAEKIGREIIRRWLRGVEPQLWHHQGRDYYWSCLTQLATYRPGGDGSPSNEPDWDNGRWVPKLTADGVDPERLAEARQQLAQEAGYLPPWASMSDRERREATVEAERWLTALRQAHGAPPATAGEVADGGR